MTLDVSGIWQGVYFYSVPGMDPVQFMARIEQNGTILGGSIREPNTFAKADTYELLSILDGYIAGPIIAFGKSYLEGENAAHTVHYVGLVNKKADFINGDWNIGNWTGRFEMRRHLIDRTQCRGVKESVET